MVMVVEVVLLVTVSGVDGGELIARRLPMTPSPRRRESEFAVPYVSVPPMC